MRQAIKNGALAAINGDGAIFSSMIDAQHIADALGALAGVEGVAETRFTAVDVVRHPLVARIIDAYDKRDRRRRST